MPKVIGYTPSWLTRPSPGAKIFSDPEPQSPVSPSKRSSYLAPTQTSTADTTGPTDNVVSRGSEIFTVVGNKIRWADLSRVKDEWDDDLHGRKQQDANDAYRTLVTPVYYQITKLAISPSGIFLAICTAHTVHIAVLPDSTRLYDNDRSPLKLKTYQLGPTTHVIPEPPLSSVLWHPLAASTKSTDCLVTVTAEAAVRVWEIDRVNQWSFERPALAIDLRKLADGVSSDQDFEPSGFGKTRGFSVDAFDMEVTAACFGGHGSADEDGWASMTLWTAMSNGDVYALCPLLPSKWRPTETTIPSLSISAVSTLATLNLEEADDDVRKAAEQRYEWVQEIDSHEPSQYESGEEEIRLRPENPSAIPRLQGPFELGQINELVRGEIADIHVIAARLDEEALMSGEDDFELMSEGMQFSVVNLSSTAGQVFVSVDVEGVSGQWLPKRGRSTFSMPTSEARDLIMLDEVNVCGAATTMAWPALRRDYSNAYTFYATTTSGIYSISLADWASRVGLEVSGDSEADSGLHTRLSVACQSGICITQELLTLDEQGNSKATASLAVPAQFYTLDLGQILVSSFDGEARAIILDGDILSQSIASTRYDNAASPIRASNALVKALEEDLPDPVPTRAPYAPANTFYVNQMQPYEEFRQRIPAARRTVLAEKPLRLSPACLDIMTLAHRTFSVQTSNVEKAAAELFRRCERLREELADQVKQMSELADRLQHINTISETEDGRKQTFDERLAHAQERQKQLVQRYEALRRKSGRMGANNKKLSTKEQIWVEEINALARKVGTDLDTTRDSIAERYEVADSLANDLVGQSKRIITEPISPDKSGLLQRSDSNTSRNSTLSLSSRLQRERIAEVMSMVEREGAIIDAVLSRLRRLNVEV